MDTTISPLEDLLALTNECLDLANQFTLLIEKPGYQLTTLDVEKLFRYMFLASAIEFRYSELIKSSEIPYAVRANMDELISKVRRMIASTLKLTVKWINLTKLTETARAKGLFT